MDEFTHHHSRRALPAVMTLFLFGLAPSNALGQTLVVDSDSRAGSVSAFVDGVGSDDPVTQSYDTVPGQTEYIPVDIDFLVEDGHKVLIVAEATLDSTSAYIGWVDGESEFDSILMDSSGSAMVNQFTSIDSQAAANDLLEMGFRVESLPDGSAYFELNGFVDNGSVRLTGPNGLDIEFTSGAFNELITIEAIGDYMLRGQGSASVQKSTAGFETESFEFSATLTTTTCSGDINADDIVNTADLLLLLASWGSCPPCPPEIVGSLGLQGQTRAVFVQDNLAYVGQGFDGFQIIDISDPTDPDPLGWAGNWTFDVVVEGTRAYIANDGAVRILDVSNPFASPTLLGTVWLSDAGADILVSGNHLYVADPVVGLTIWDVTDPSTPTFLDDFLQPDLDCMALSGNRLYVGSTTLPWVWTLDVSNPTSLVMDGFINTPALDIEVSGGYAYIHNGANGIRVLDVSDPTNMTLVGSLDTAPDTTELAVQGNRLYLADLGDGLEIIDISDPTSPSFINSVSPSDIAPWALHVVGSDVFVADLNFGLKVVDTACYTPCLGDVDEDRYVNTTDLLGLLSAWGPCP